MPFVVVAPTNVGISTVVVKFTICRSIEEMCDLDLFDDYYDWTLGNDIISVPRFLKISRLHI